MRAKKKKKNSTKSKRVTSTARVEPGEMEIINRLAYDVDKLMVKSESRWTVLKTALNHSVATLMIHGWIFVLLMMIILAVLDHFEQNSSFERRICNMKTLNESLDTSMLNNHSFCSENANITKINLSITFTSLKNARILLVLTS